MKPYFALASFLLLLPLQAGATIFQNNGDLNCTYPVTLSAESITCNDTEYCHFGDEMSIYGSMTLEENLPSSTMCVTTSICFMGSFVCKTYKKTTNICNAVGVSSQNDGTACPNAGSFSFGSTVKLPGNGFFNFGSGKRAAFFSCYRRLAFLLFRLVWIFWCRLVGGRYNDGERLRPLQ